jgi:tellurite resistance protein TehA-like permease
MRTPGHRLALTLFLTVLALWLAAMAIIMRHAALPPEASGTMLVVFEPGTSEPQAFASLTRAEARVVKQTDLGFVWIVAGEEPGLAGRLIAQGAIGAYRELPISPTIAGCFALADAKAASLLP